MTTQGTPPNQQPQAPDQAQDQAQNPAPIKSEFAGDPDMAELVELFVGELTERTEKITTAMQSQDWSTLRTMAHQLKGASGGYGFPTIGAKAAEVEDTVKEDPEARLGDLRRQVDELVDVCNRAAA